MSVLCFSCKDTFPRAGPVRVCMLQLLEGFWLQLDCSGMHHEKCHRHYCAQRQQALYSITTSCSVQAEWSRRMHIKAEPIKSLMELACLYEGWQPQLLTTGLPRRSWDLAGGSAEREMTGGPVLTQFDIRSTLKPQASSDPDDRQDGPERCSSQQSMYTSCV